MDASNFVRDIYRPRIEAHFKDHPLHDVIMQAYDRGDASPEQWDLWFSETESIGWERLMALGDKLAKGEITLTFRKAEDS
jgi:hypothetical protein